MKKLFKLCVVSLAAAVLVAFTGCSARSTISSDEFQKQAKSAGYTVTAQTQSDTTVTKCLAATKSNSDTQIFYLTFSSAANAQSWYSSQKNGLSGTGKTVVDTDTYNKYNLTNGEIYYLLARMDDTAVFCKTTVAKKSEADNFVSSIKY